MEFRYDKGENITPTHHEALAPTFANQKYQCNAWHCYGIYLSNCPLIDLSVEPAKCTQKAVVCVDLAICASMENRTAISAAKFKFGRPLGGRSPRCELPS